jgi:hypothetical protein
MYWKHNQCELLLMLGLPFLAKVIKAGSAEDKFNLLEEHLIPSIAGVPDFLTKALTAEPSRLGHGHGHRRRRRWLEFQGDTKGGPNSAWVQSKKNGTRAHRNCWFEDAAENWRQWGYCLWDEKRLKGWGIGEWSWSDGQRRKTRRWVCTEQVRPSGRVVPKWDLVADGTA